MVVKQSPGLWQAGGGKLEAVLPLLQPRVEQQQRRHSSRLGRVVKQVPSLWQPGDGKLEAMLSLGARHPQSRQQQQQQQQQPKLLLLR